MTRKCCFCYQEIINAVEAGSQNEAMKPTYVGVSEEFLKSYRALPAYYQRLRLPTLSSPFFNPAAQSGAGPDEAAPDDDNAQTITAAASTEAVTEEATSATAVAHAVCSSSAGWSANQYEIDKARVQQLEELRTEFRNYFFLPTERQQEIRNNVKVGGYKTLLTDLANLKARLTTFAAA